VIVLALLAILAVLVAALATRRSARPRPSTERVGADDRGTSVVRGPEDGEPEDAIEAALTRWSRAGLLTDEQVAALRAHDAQAGPPAATAPEGERRPAGRVPVLAEALGYLGGSLAIAGVVLVVSHAWSDLGLGARLALPGSASLALLAVGAAVRGDRDPALGRLRDFAWVASSAAAGLFGGVAAHDGLPTDAATTFVLAGAGAVVVHAGALWRGRDRPAHQLLTEAAGVVAAGCAAESMIADGPAGLVIWAAGAALVAAGLGRIGPHPHLTGTVGAVALVAGSIVVPGQWQGPGLVLAAFTAAAIALAPVVPLPLDRGFRIVAEVVGAAAVVLSVPATIGYFAERAGVATGAVVWACGAAMLALGVTGVARAPRTAQGLGAIVVLVGAGVTAAQVPDVAPAIGLVTAVGLLVVGTVPGAVLVSLVGAAGLLVNVPWAIARWFPGEGRAPVIIGGSGLVILAVAVALARMGGRFQAELGRPGHHRHRRHLRGAG
jgi:hypothetical protein